MRESFISDEEAVGPSDDAESVRRGILRIARDAAANSGTLPGEFELARLLGTSRPQVRRVLATLELAGVVSRHQGASTTVDPTALRMTVRLDEQLDHAELLSRLGYEPTVELITSEVIPLPTHVARELTTQADGRCHHGVKKWRADGTVAMIGEGHTVLPPGYEGTPDGEASVFARAEQLWGEPIIWEIATPGVAVLDERWAAEFELPVGSPCLTLQIVGVTRSGRKVFSAFERHHPDIVRYSIVRTLQPVWDQPWIGRG